MIVIDYILSALIATAAQILLLLGPGLLFAFLIHFLAGYVERGAMGLLGKKTYLLLFGWLGTSVHELGHALFCLLFGHKITGMRLFYFDRTEGRLGYVSHSYNKKNIYQRIGNFFIGIGPIILATAVIFTAAYFLIGVQFFVPFGNIHLPSFDSQVFDSLQQFVLDFFRGILEAGKFIFNSGQFGRWEFYLFLYIVFSVGSGTGLSKSDFKGALQGFTAFIIVLFILNLLTNWFDDFLTVLFSDAGKFLSTFYLMMVLTLLINLLGAVILFFIPESMKKIKEATRNK